MSSKQPTPAGDRDDADTPDPPGSDAAVGVPVPRPGWGSESGALRVAAPCLEPDAVARALISETIHTYGWAYDECQPSILREVLTNDVTFSRVFAGCARNRPTAGQEPVIRELQSRMSGQRDQRRHHFSSIVITEMTRNRARAIAALLLTAADGSTSRIVGTGFYECSLREEAGRWKLASIRLGLDTRV